ncbi:4624_t:CDS:2 [Funneliformis caledonium]|uniref:4624_t:CDS:1 n=1 Tax=Funneliformis caledonium TaxID=1117310 RepID=A0A9N9FMV4_9GLOM|nr:4624_t:CDS:2 [Funneliformis caledonium]
MDVEARRKFCGLLMFDIPTISVKSPTSRNNDIIINNMSTQEVDPSSLNHNPLYESSRNAGSLMNSIDHQFIIQDGFSQIGDFSTTTRALAAGAAAGDDPTNQGTLDPSNATDGDTKSQPPKRTPRPPNAFILYRRAKQPAIIASQRSLTNAEVSRTISDMWRKEPEETRLEWERYADRKKLEHMQTYPNYVYRPNKNKSKVDKRRQNRRQNTKDSANASNDPSNSENKTTGTSAITRRKSTKTASRLPSKLDMPLSMNIGMTGFNMQQHSPSISPMNQHPPSAISTSRTDTMNSTSSYTTILPSPEIPLLTSHFTDSPEDYVTSQSQFTPLTPDTPLTPISTPEQMQIREHDFKIRQQQQFQNSILRFVPEEELNSINGLASFHHHPTNGFSHQTVDPLEFCLVPDVAQQQQQMMAEFMLHHEPHHITPTSTVPSSNNGSIHPASSIPVQYYSSGSNAAAALTGNPSFTEMLGFEFQNFLGENHHHNGNDLDVNASDHYLQ